MVEEADRRRGGQPGNQNARKKCFYFTALSEEEKADCDVAGDLDGIDDEIKLARVKTKLLAEHSPHDFALIMRSLRDVGRLVRMRKDIGKDERLKMEAMVKNVLQDLTVPADVVQERLEREGRDGV